MANYKSSNIAGSSYIRCNALTIRNPKDGTPSVDFFEERYFDVDASPSSIPITDKRFLVDVDFNAEFDVLNPTTGNPIGSRMKVRDMYMYLYSYYIDQATKRDEREAAHAAYLEAMAAAAVTPETVAPTTPTVDPVDNATTALKEAYVAAVDNYVKVLVSNPSAEVLTAAQATYIAAMDVYLKAVASNVNNTGA